MFLSYSGISRSFFDRCGNFGIEEKTKKRREFDTNNGIICFIIAITVVVILVIISGLIVGASVWLKIW